MRRVPPRLGILPGLMALGLQLQSVPASPPPIDALRVTILSTNLAGNPGEGGIGEWGFAALVEANGFKLLFDTGHRPETVLKNARELKVDLSDVTHVVLSHHHDDHTGGLLTLRQSLVDQHPDALSQVHVGRGAFWRRGGHEFDGDDNPLIALRPKIEHLGGNFIEHDSAAELAPGVWLTGPIKRVFDEQRAMRNPVIAPGQESVPDTLPEDIALVLDTTKGLVVLTGCGHAGLINTLLQARAIARPEATVYAAIGGFHLAGMPDDRIAWTAERLAELGLQHFHGAHCTGIAPVYQIKAHLGLPRESIHVGAVGAAFDLQSGITPLWIAR
jgi:7,8-dihydropterin-6-yl-methyl-4-(beta-D-ribofuranosyl)aminobenzene 5'-phosphate synthase